MNNPNVDANEIAKFSSYASVWWDPKGPFAPLHAINPPRLSFIQRHVQLANKEVLDVGCGAGILSESLSGFGAKVVAIDASNKVIDIAIQHAKQNNLDIEYHNLTIEQYIADHNKQFDVITCMELIEHVPDPQQLINNCARLLKPGGKFFISTINRTLKAYLFAIIGAEFVLNILPKNTHTYAKFIKPSEMHSLLTNAQLDMQDLSGMSYQPFSKQASLCSNTNINYLAYAVKE